MGIGVAELLIIGFVVLSLGVIALGGIGLVIWKKRDDEKQKME